MILFGHLTEGKISYEKIPSVQEPNFTQTSMSNSLDEESTSMETGEEDSTQTNANPDLESSEDVEELLDKYVFWIVDHYLETLLFLKI